MEKINKIILLIKRFLKVKAEVRGFSRKFNVNRHIFRPGRYVKNDFILTRI